MRSILRAVPAKGSCPPEPPLHDLAPAREDFATAVRQGLARCPRELPCKFLYDERGSWLFERICELEEYYPTRTELQIMRSCAGEMAHALGHDCLLVEYGSGSSLKTRILLDHLRFPAGYVPIDISRQQVLHAARSLAAAYPRVPILPVCADYTADVHLPPGCRAGTRKAIYFPGSTIGNFHPHEAVDFLRRARRLCGQGGALLIGVDLKKDLRILHAAYNDSSGVTAAFNLNLLSRINRELAGDFDLDRFAHYAFYNPHHGRIEMHLVSLADQTARAAGQTFPFHRGQTIFTESSYKYHLDDFQQLASAAGWTPQHLWTDPHHLFSVQYLTASA